MSEAYGLQKGFYWAGRYLMGCFTKYNELEG